MGNIRRIVFATLLATTLACGSEEGLIVQVTADDLTPATVTSLEFVVATRQSDGVSSLWVKDVASSVTVSPDSGDLAVDPYRLFLHNGTELGPDTEVMVAVFAYVGADEVAFGTLAPAQRFMPGKVLQREIMLHGYVGGTRPYALTDHGCLGWPVELGQEVVIGTKEDKDCDGDRVAQDCDDYDPDRGTVLCYGSFPECDFGWRACTNGVPSADCTQDPRDPTVSVPERFCLAYDECVANRPNEDPFTCASVTAADVLDCYVAFSLQDGLCPSLPVPLSAQNVTSCFWSIIDGQAQTQYKVGLSSLPDPATAGAEAATCDVFFHVLEGNPQPDIIWLGRVGDSIAQLLRVNLTPLVVQTTCPPLDQPIDCVLTAIPLGESE